MDENNQTDEIKTILHTVRTKETLASLSRLYKTDIDTLMRLNQLGSPEIQIGQTLNVPSSTKQHAKKKNSRSTKQNHQKIVKKNNRHQAALKNKKH